MDISKIGSNSIINNAQAQTDTLKGKAADDDFEKRLQGAVNKNDDKELKKVCKDFESIMLSLMYKQMRATVPKSDLIPEDEGSEIFQSMLDDDLMQEASKANGIGLGDILYKQLSRQLKSSDKSEGNK